MEDRDLGIIAKMLGYAKDVLEYCEGLDYSAFAGDKHNIAACVFSISQLGELSKHLGRDFKAEHPALPWHSIYNLRNRIVHDYEGLRLDVIWQVIESNLPLLCGQPSEILKEARL